MDPDVHAHAQAVGLAKVVLVAKTSQASVEKQTRQQHTAEFMQR